MRAALILLTLTTLAPAASAATTVEAMEYAFRPATATAAEGGILRVVNVGAEPHTYTSATPAHPFELLLREGETKDLVLAFNGTVHVYCRFHASPQATAAEGMAGDLVVLPASRNPPREPPATSSTPSLGAGGVGLALAAAALLAFVRR